MGRPKKIPEQLYEAIRQKRAEEGMGTRAIAAWLKDQHKLEISHQTVNKLLGELMAERAEVTRAVIAEKVGRHVASDLDMLAVQTHHLKQIADALHLQMIDEPTGQPRDGLFHCIGKTPIATVHASVSAQLKAILDLKLKLGGAPDGTAGGHGPITSIPPESDT